jgi:hypothetical protein
MPNDDTGLNVIMQPSTSKTKLYTWFKEVFSKSESKKAQKAECLNKECEQ